MASNGDAHRDRKKVRRMLRPQSIAVVGASEQPQSLGTRYLGGLLRHGFAGSVYAVNPKYDTVMGLPAYDSLGEIPDGCDLAVLSVREDLVVGAMRESAERGIAGAMVFAGGYRETGPEGIEKERRLVELGRELGVRVIGPNSPGFMNFVDRAVVTATSVAFRESFPPGGRLGVIAQSGGVAGIVAERAMDRGLGLSFMLCSGNEVDFDTAEAVEFLVDDPDTDAIAMYYEGVADPDRLLVAWEYASEHDVPVIIFTPGGSDASRRAAASHTGSEVGDDAAFDRRAAELGVVRVLDLDEMLEAATALPKLPAATDPRVLLITTSGGGAVLAADALGRAGLRLPPLAESLQAELAKILRPIGTFVNPVDMTSDPVQNPPSFAASMEIVSLSEDHDVIVLSITVQGPELAAVMADTIAASPEAREGRLVVLWYAGAMSDSARVRLRSEGVLVFDTPRGLAAALAGSGLWSRRSRG
jgi:acyl-CoA synthetase (NDP forming)